MCSYSKIHEWQTRLVLIKPSEDPSAILQLNLVVVDLVDLKTGVVINHDTIVTYDALSYAWGTAPPSVECICDWVTILLRDNLASALRYLRRPQDERYIWIDFLCINQDDLVEKAVQIPRMKNIYSKASTVIVWLGESEPVHNIVRRCNKDCGPDVDILACSNHKEQLWKSILDYTWFRRTWVRQEVFAAERLDVCSPDFSTTWEHFTGNLRTLTTLNSRFGHDATQNLMALEGLYSSRRLKLLDLLKQGKGFQASKQHDHIFSVLGMMSTLKHNVKAPFPVSYLKSYEETCGDVTRSIIRDTQSTGILRLCALQQNRSHVFNWPEVETRCSISGEVQTEIWNNKGDALVEQFVINNPMREVGASIPSEHATTSSKLGQSVSVTPLVLYGRAWGTLTWLSKHVNFDGYDETYSVDNETDDDIEAKLDSQEHDNTHREFHIFKRGLVRFLLGSSELEATVTWRCMGSPRCSDIFVSLEPGPSNFLLRKCVVSGDMYEVVGWGGRMERYQDCHRAFEPVKDETAYYLANSNGDDCIWDIDVVRDPPGERKLYRIR